MASIFTFDPDPPKVASLWSGFGCATSPGNCFFPERHLGGLPIPPPLLLEDQGITKLAPEPQEGPIEYKLHLLLRPGKPSPAGDAPSSGSAERPLPVPTFQSRQNRLQHLTTQLLWRLQQSSHFHSSATTDLVLPVLPEALDLDHRPTSNRLLPGLEDSKGALYEIGVSDDGTFVGLVPEEMDESLKNLVSMAASLGCRVEILRVIIVGKVYRISTRSRESMADGTTMQLIVEALVLPGASRNDDPLELISDEPPQTTRILDSASAQVRGGPTLQVRISLTGSTRSGKSSLLGTLSTSTLDNGRGKSRLSLLRHRHEITSGVTSSLAPELIGYPKYASNVINYAQGNVSSWIDIHNDAVGGKLIFINDSAGHPRFRRTIIRGLVSWAPHWTICCTAAGEVEEIATRASSPGISIPPPELSTAHLDLCLKLKLPLIIAITKYDLATMTGLKQTLGRVLSALKKYGRHPFLLKPGRSLRMENELQLLDAEDEAEIHEMLTKHQGHLLDLVPILLTSAVTGAGVGKLHSIMKHLPHQEDSEDLALDPPLLPSDFDTLYRIDEVFEKAEDRMIGSRFSRGNILSGYLGHGKLSVGDRLLLGPFLTDVTENRCILDVHQARSYSSRLDDRLMFPDSGSSLRSLQPRDTIRDSLRESTQTSSPISTNDSQIQASQSQRLDSARKNDQWKWTIVSSIRNLRLPVNTLCAGQVGTVGIEFEEQAWSSGQRLRKGMQLIHLSTGVSMEKLQAYTGFSAIFDEQDYLIMEPGQFFNVYMGTIRASGKILSVASADTVDLSLQDHSGGGVFDSDSLETQHGNDSKRNTHIEVTFRLMLYQEWFEIGSQVLIMPANASEASVASLEGYVGKISRGRKE